MRPLTLIPALLLAGLLHAEVIRFEITERVPFGEGASFGKTGTYERISGKVHYAVDPAAPQNAAIVDLARAPRNAAGKVEFESDLIILRPADPAKGNRALFYEVNNRGGRLGLRFFNRGGEGKDPKTGKVSGNGFFFRYGFTVVWSGWDGELLASNSGLKLLAPVARNGDHPITGPVRYEIISDKEESRLNINGGGHGAYHPTEKGVETASLTWRQRPGDPRVPIPRSQFTLHVSEVNPEQPGRLPKVELELHAGFQRGYIYEVIYEGRDPIVQGTGFASVRDLISALKNGGGEGNPLRGEDGKTPIDHAFGFGVSQSGRFLREYLYWAFNEDEAGRKVFDGLIPNVAGGGLGSFNHRFAQPTMYVTQYAQHDTPSDRFPFTYGIDTDPAGGEPDGILKRCKPEHLPVVFHTQSSAEYWTRSGSLPHTDPTGRRDAEVPENVRFYTFGGTQHGPSGYPPSRGIGQTPANPGNYYPFLRGLLVAMHEWVRDGKDPPPSVYPTIRSGTLVDWDQRSTGFPSIPGVRYPEVIQQPARLDFGPRWESERIVDQLPPRPGKLYGVRVAKCDADGNVLGCLLPPEVTVPIATYTGWNLRRREAGAQNQLVSLNGSYLPFAVSRKERLAQGDPRLSIEERYESPDGYLRKVRKACDEQVRLRYLLAEDVDDIVRRQEDRIKPLFEKLREAGGAASPP